MKSFKIFDYVWIYLEIEWMNIECTNEWMKKQIFVHICFYMCFYLFLHQKLFSTTPEKLAAIHQIEWKVNCKDLFHEI